MSDEDLPWIEGTLSQIAKFKDPRTRRREVARLLRAPLSADLLSTEAGKALLHRRALLVTALRDRELWP